jgi:hypothetical protein
MFAFAVAFLSKLRSHCKRHPDTIAYLRPKLAAMSRLCWDFLCVVADLARRLVSELRGQTNGGFDKVPVTEEDNADNTSNTTTAAVEMPNMYLHAPTASMSIIEEAVVSPISPASSKRNNYFVRRKVGVGDDGIERWEEIELEAATTPGISSDIQESTMPPRTSSFNNESSGIPTS